MFYFASHFLASVKYLFMLFMWVCLEMCKDKQMHCELNTGECRVLIDRAKRSSLSLAGTNSILGTQHSPMRHSS